MSVSFAREAPGRVSGLLPETGRGLTVIQLTWSLVAGGAETYAYNIARGLKDRGYRPLICALDQGGALEGEIRRARIPCIVMNRRPGIDVLLCWRLWRLFRAIRPDVVHTHHFNQLFYGGISARLSGARVIHTEHSVSLYSSRRFRIALRILSWLCDRVTVVGHQGKHVLVETVGIPLEKLQTVAGGVDAVKFCESRESARSDLGIDEQDRVVAIVARLYPEKNHRLLLRAFSEVARRIERARLLIVGDGIERRAIAAEVERLNLEDRVSLFGVRRDIPRILAACDVFALPSHREGLPIAVLEAMAAARPVVASAVGDLPCIIKDGKSGILFDPGDSEALAAALTRILEDPVLAGNMGDCGRSAVISQFALSAMVEKYESLYSARSTPR
ncbi:MAG TPA: glycosyltransferase [Blastocatellia bacterium]|nr:glycosyltransferase [Blastocatellia bacterium]